MEDDHIIKTLKYFNEVISEGENENSEVIRENIQKQKEEEAKLAANDAILREADTFANPKIKGQEIENFCNSDNI